MKRSKKLWVLLTLLVVICAATFALTRFEEHKEQIKTTGEIILDIPAETVQSLSWETEEVSLSFHREESWVYDDDPAFPVDKEEIDRRLELFQSFGAAFIIEEVVDYSPYGLDDPICTISLTTDTQSYEIALGTFSTMDAQRYLSIGDGSVYLVTRDPMDLFSAVLDDIMDHDEAPDFDQVSELSFSGTENYRILYEDNGSSYREEDVYYAQRNGDALPLDTERVEDYLDFLSSLSLSDYATYNVTDAQLAEYGLDDPEFTVTVSYSAGDETDEAAPSDLFTLNISRDAETIAAARKAEEDAEDEDTEEEEETPFNAYVRVGSSPIVYRLTESAYETLTAVSYDDLRHREVLPANAEDISRIDVLLEDTEYTFTAESVDGEQVYSYLEEELEFFALPSALKKLSGDSFTAEKPDKKQEISLTVHLDQPDSPSVLIELYRYDGTHCLAVVDGEPFSLVSRATVVDLMESVFAVVLES